MKIGNLTLESNIFLAPMAEITDYPFRAIAKKYGAGLTYTQMVSADGVLKNNFNTLRLLTFSRDEKPIGVQLLGKDPDIVGRAVRELINFSPDVIDLNCGCPVDKVYSNKMGAYLLSQPKTLGKLVTEMVKNAEGIPISIKIRLGHKNQVNVLENAKIIEDSGASLIAVHARLRNDRYDVEADWEWIARVKDQVNIPVIGNGSVFEAEDAIRMLSETGCDAVLLGRGALGNPFIFKQIELLKKGESFTPTIEEIAQTALEHVVLLEKEQGLTVNLDRAKKNIIWYFMNQNGIENLISELYLTGDFDGLKEIII
ncbi:MAG: tRNA dihydrouridine synthase DusB, partial [Melioribacteraceae bacterium]|nr:tRNA dihydrouridine synthase DusB [Melioribacteraceae bacterium]